MWYLRAQTLDLTSNSVFHLIWLQKPAVYSVAVTKKHREASSSSRIDSWDTLGQAWRRYWAKFGAVIIFLRAQWLTSEMPESSERITCTTLQSNVLEKKQHSMVLCNTSTTFLFNLLQERTHLQWIVAPRPHHPLGNTERWLLMTHND